MATFHRPYKGGGNRRFFKKREPDHKINDRITATEVRLVGDNIEDGVYPIAQALKFAVEQDLDLVELVPGADPPVCKVIDYQKFIYEKKKKEKEQKAKAHKTVVKEIRFGPNTDEHDFQFKLNHARKFLEEGSKVKAYVHFKGRTIAYKEKGEIILLRLASELEEIGKVEQLPKLEGNRMFLHLQPLHIKKVKKS